MTTASDARVGDERPPETARQQLIGILIVAVAAAVLAVVIFIYRRDVPITGDGLRVINERLPLTIHTLLRPFHEHLNAVPIALWSILPTTAEKLAAMLVAHVVLATATAAFLIARLGRLIGVALALPLALLGSAYYDLFVSWQILFMIPLACGLVAIVASLPRERTWALRGLVVVFIGIAVGSSNVGLFLACALGLWFLLERRWTQILELVPVGVAWVAWFLVVFLHSRRDEAFKPSLMALPYSVTAISSGIGGVTGLGVYGGLAIIAAAAAFVIWRRVTVPPALIAFGVTLVVMFGILSAFRSSGSLTQAQGSRYIYLTAFFLAFGVGIAAPRLPRSRWWLVASLVATAINVQILAHALPGYP
ncbi:MAG TPA: hypothetical protein VE011_01985 [Candidatus Dormibacteraeota bacterium]|nr:hypothetical protein [Candidatus Dormibacteraeota bacterium]